MAAWFTVYCSRSLGHVTVEHFRSWMDRNDFRTDAEAFGIDDDEAVDRALASLKLESADGSGGVRFRLTYGRPNRRPILIHIHSDSEVLEEERDEAEELLDEAGGRGVRHIRSHLDRMVELVEVELGWSQLEDMGVVFAGAVSEYLAVVGEGLIWDPYDVWWAIEDHCPVRLAGPEPRWN